MLSSLPFFYAFCWSAIPTSCYILYAFILAHVLFFKQQMHAWAEVCHLLQSSKSPLTGFLCSIGWRIIWPDQAFFNSISNSAILHNNYISLLCDLCACVHVKKNGVARCYPPPTFHPLIDAYGHTYHLHSSLLENLTSWSPTQVQWGCVPKIWSQWEGAGHG